MIYTIVCTDTSERIHWQCELLEYSWSKQEQSGKLIRLVASETGNDLPVHRHAEVYRTNFTNIDPNSGDNYPPYNRLYSIKQWLEQENPDGTILILDPDMVFRRNIKKGVKSGSPSGVHWLDFGMQANKIKVTEEISSVEYPQLQPLTWPALIHTDDLIKLMPRWIELTIEYRNRTGGWEDDMFAFTVACAELGLVFSFDNLCAWTPWPEEKVAGAPIIHFCQPIKDSAGEVIWSKNNYPLWDRLTDIDKANAGYCRDLLGIVDEYARIKSAANENDKSTIFIAIASYCEPELITTIQSCLTKAMHPENLRFGICLQYDNGGGNEVSEDCIDEYLKDSRFQIVKYDYKQSKGGCWARNTCQAFYKSERYTLQIDAHSQMRESWDVLLIDMLQGLPSDKPLISSFPPLYTLDENKNIERFHLDALDRISTTYAKRWNNSGWIEQVQKYIPENNQFPRQTRFISGAFVFTLGRWNEEVRQDPDHFYTGEEFALTLRSFTHGYDLFDPSEIVVWHRLHPQPNRKFWHDNEDGKTHARHNKAISRLQKLMNGDTGAELGRYGLGGVRSLDDYRDFSGLDCQKLSIDVNAETGVPPFKTKIPTEAEYSAPSNQSSEPEIVQVTVHLKGRNPLEFDCMETDQVLTTLFGALFQNKNEQPQSKDDVIYLQIGQETPKVFYFLGSQLTAIETDPPRSMDFLVNIIDQTQVQFNKYLGLTPVFNDSWKHWIWDNVNRGCAKSEIHNTLLANGFRSDDIQFELGISVDDNTTQDTAVIDEDSVRFSTHFIANSKRLDCDKVELYSVNNFLSAHECKEIYALLAEELEPSTTVSKTDNRKGRTSQTNYFKTASSVNSAITEVRSRICKLMGINPSYAENIQGHFYQVGEEYEPHFDWFQPDSDVFATEANDGKGGQRTWSAIIYLNEVAKGGGTRFVDIDITIESEGGKLVVWNNILPSGRPNPYVLHHALPVIEGEKGILTLWFREKGEGEMNSRQHGEDLVNYTAKGYKKVTIPRQLFLKINQFYHDNVDAITDESIPEFLSNIRPEDKVSDLVVLPRDLKVEISQSLKSTLEQWSNESLVSTAVYGIRRYYRGAKLKIHRDIRDTHIISAILNIEQEVDKDWPLVIEDNYYRRHEVVLRPGDMLMYEGARASHGRPEPFEGNHFCNVFVHFIPVDDNYIGSDEIKV